MESNTDRTTVPQKDPSEATLLTSNAEKVLEETTKIMEENNVVSKYRTLTGIIRFVPVVLISVVILLSLNWMFDLRFFMNIMMESYTFYYLIVACLGSLVFLLVPASKKSKGKREKPLFFVDCLLAAVVFFSNVYLAANAYNIYMQGWERIAPPLATVISVALLFLYIEMARRCAGNAITIVIVLVALLPIYTQYMPGVLNGLSKPFLLTAQMHILGTDSSMGTLIRTFADIVLPYTIFGTVIVACGGGNFFLDLAIAAFGRFRGGTAKVAIISSALFGSISGNPVVNVLTTGSVTIPAMKKSGFDSVTAGAVEACASTAGTMTPPIMGTASFVMAAFLGVSYSEVAIAAVVPILLYYITILFSMDMYAAKKGLKGLAKSEMPDLRKTLKDGWFFIPVMAVLIVCIFVFRKIPQAAIYASFVAIVLQQLNKTQRLDKAKTFKMLHDIGTNCMEIIAVMLGVGFILGSFSMTGIGISFPREVYLLAGGNTVILIILTALTSLIMGMGMTTIACYIFLSIVIAPALVLTGLDAMGVHLFLLYCGMLSYITPPVAVATIPASVLAQAPGTKIGFTAMRLGIALFLVPFFFVTDPNLLLRGTVLGSIQSIGTALVGILFITQALEGYLLGAGEIQIKHKKALWIPVKMVMIAGGFLLGLPGTLSDLLGLALVLAAVIPLYAYHFRLRKTPGLT